MTPPQVIVVNRWPCAYIDDGEIIAIIKRHTWSRLVLRVGAVYYLQGQSHLPDDDLRAELSCVTYLCASGLACSEHKGWVLGYLFPAFTCPVIPDN